MPDRRLPELLIVLNFFDAIVTYFLVSKGTVEELNPFMNALIQHHPLTFLITKTIFVTGLALFLTWADARKALFSLTAVYALLALYHLRSLWLLSGV
jgi:hypothetical protein